MGSTHHERSSVADSRSSSHDRRSSWRTGGRAEPIGENSSPDERHSWASRPSSRVFPRSSRAFLRTCDPSKRRGPYSSVAASPPSAPHSPASASPRAASDVPASIAPASLVEAVASPAALGDPPSDWPPASADPTATEPELEEPELVGEEPEPDCEFGPPDPALPPELFPFPKAPASELSAAPAAGVGGNGCPFRLQVASQATLETRAPMTDHLPTSRPTSRPTCRVPIPLGNAWAVPQSNQGNLWDLGA
jgi:hypothetical protein